MDNDEGAARYVQTRAARGVLKRLDVSKESQAPVEELRLFLKLDFQNRTDIHPKQMERIVSSIFKERGYEVVQTAYSADDGIDIYLIENGEETIGVQVKRTKNAIGAEAIRTFAGALVLSGKTSGVYVTTSKYTRGASETAARYETRGIQLDLVDAEGLLSAIASTTSVEALSHNSSTAPFAPLLSDTRKIPFLGDAAYYNGRPVPGCRSGFDQKIPEVISHDLVRKTTDRAKNAAIELLRRQLE